MNYWIIDVSAGCPWGYSFCVKAETDCDDRFSVLSAVLKTNLFRNINDCYGCAIHLFGYDAEARIEDWIDDATLIEIEDEKAETLK